MLLNFKEVSSAFLNYKHLRYYWMVAKTGSIAKATEQLHLTPHAVSGQINEFEQSLGVELFKKSGRNLELTEAGRRIMVYADDIFTTGDQLLDVLRNQLQTRRRHFRVGIADAVPKVIRLSLTRARHANRRTIALKLPRRTPRSVVGRAALQAGCGDC